MIFTLKSLFLLLVSCQKMIFHGYIFRISPQFGGKEIRGEEMTAEGIKRQMTELEWNKVYQMSRDRNLYQNLISSLFPTIHGNDEVKRGETNGGLIWLGS